MRTDVMLKIRMLILLAGILFFIPLRAQERMAKDPLPLFQSDSLLELELKADFGRIFPVTDDSTYFLAEITFTDNAGSKRTLEIEVRTRGNTRRQENICHFPPLRLRFPKEGTENTAFEEQRAIKLVTHCNRAEQFEQNTIAEYLIYRAYNIMTDSSLRVRPARIKYIDAQKETDTLERFAFFIEREKHLAERFHAVDLEPEGARPEKIIAKQACLVDIFQYMIGNTDYSIFKSHNIFLISDPDERGQSVPVPYDFDWSGLVAAHYAVPHPLMKTESVTERVYRGLKQEPETVFRTVALYQSKKEEILQLFENNPWLDNKEKKFASRYLGDFFKMLDHERSVQNEFIKNARAVDE